MVPYESMMECLEAMKIRDAAPSRLLLLPAEIREQIWLHALTSWTRNPAKPVELIKQPIRVDSLNRPLPPALTRVNRQLYTETLHLYYANNIFECWRPLLHSPAWSCSSTLMFWLNSLGLQKAHWLTSVVLLYKKESELEDNFRRALAMEGFAFRHGVLSFRQELTEYELCYEQLGLPRHFGRHGGRWR